ncbi:hypothetical protein ACIBCT_15785 [Streptosporangium sp. NPDC050855]|uniref:hypothetical protein n=1 Tax=Streptosporangium sp. NPDC050855 TaxID=3366194 RepID=UPI0037AE3F42
MRLSGLTRVTSAAAHLQVFAISGISAVLLTRAYLQQAGYPQLGGGSLHIAHVLWGGLLMMVGLGVTLAFLGQGARTWGAVVGGVGFGLFIDEVGKFVTQTTDYFYRPAAGIIYLVFATLVTLSRWLEGRTDFSPRERTANAVHAALIGATSGLTVEQRQAAVRLVQGSDDALDAAVVRLLGMVPARKTTPGWFRTWSARARATLDGLTRRPLLVALVVVYLVVQALLPLVGLALENAHDSLGGEREWGAVIGMAVAAATTGVLAMWGTVRLRGDRAAAFRLFGTAMLVDVLFGQAFAFVVNQFSALPGLASDLLILAVVSAESRRLRTLD